MFNYFKWNILKLVFTYYHFKPTTNQRLFDKKAILKLQNYIFTKINLATKTDSNLVQKLFNNIVIENLKISAKQQFHFAIT